MRVLPQRATLPPTPVDGGVGEVDVEHHGPTPAGVDLAGVEVEGELLAGDLTHRHRAAYVEGLGGAELGELGGGPADGGLEVQRVGRGRGSR